VRFLPGRFNLLPDALSRSFTIHPEWTVQPQVGRLRGLFQQWGWPQVDLFASSKTQICPRYVSSDVTEPEAAWYDAYSRSWQFRCAWVFPPPPEIPRVLRHLQTASGRFLLLTPDWTGAWWRPELQRLTRVPPLPVPADWISDASTNKPLPNEGGMCFLIWILSYSKGVPQD